MRSQSRDLVAARSCIRDEAFFGFTLDKGPPRPRVVADPDKSFLAVSQSSLFPLGDVLQYPLR